LKKGNQAFTGRTLLQKKSCKARQVLFVPSSLEIFLSFTASTILCKSICQRWTWIVSRRWARRNYQEELVLAIIMWQIISQ